MSPNPIVIIGGGISGLSLAYYLQKFCYPKILPQKIIIIESQKRLGGWLHTRKCDDGVVHEFGPKSIRLQGLAGSNVLSLADELGLHNEAIGVPQSSLAARKRQILINNNLVELPNTFVSLFSRLKVLPKPLIYYVIRDYRTPSINLDEYHGDISVHDFAKHRLGEEMANLFFDPMCRGIFAGDSRKLSVVSCFPQMFIGEQRFGSIMRGMAFSNQEMTKLSKKPKTELELWATSNKWSVWSFREGIQTLSDKLCEYMLSIDGNPIEIYNESTVNNLEFDNSGDKVLVNIKTSQEDDIVIEADHVFSAIPAQQLSSILPESVSPKLRDTLNTITSVSIASVNLEYRGNALPEDAGFGFLVPSNQKSNVLGVAYDSCLFPFHTNGVNCTRLTCMMGGEWFDQIFGDVNHVSAEKILTEAIEAVGLHLGIKDTPIRYFVNIHKNCIPQYHLGHKEKLEVISKEIENTGIKLALVGASYKGVSVPDCIYNSKLTAHSYAQSLAVV